MEHRKEFEHIVSLWIFLNFEYGELLYYEILENSDGGVDVKVLYSSI